MEISTHTYRCFGADIALYVNIGDFSAERNENDERGRLEKRNGESKGGGGCKKKDRKREQGRGRKETRERGKGKHEKKSD